MSIVKRCVYAIAVSALATLAVRADDLAAIQKRLISEYPLTQATADDTDIVTAGAVLVLKKSDLVMASTSGVNLYQNTYKEGRITQNAFGKLFRLTNQLPGSNGSNGTRTYVAGEKMWVTRIEVREEKRDDAVVFELLTDPVGDDRFKAALKFPFPRDTTADQVDQLVSEVFGVQQDEPQQQAQPARGSVTTLPSIAPPPLPAQATTPLPEIPPPPPPTDKPATALTTVGLGQTPVQVIAALGQPDKDFKLTKKEIFYYHNLKVTFVGGKVTDVE